MSTWNFLEIDIRPWIIHKGVIHNVCFIISNNGFRYFYIRSGGRSVRTAVWVYGLNSLELHRHANVCLDLVTWLPEWANLTYLRLSCYTYRYIYMCVCVFQHFVILYKLLNTLSIDYTILLSSESLYMIKSLVFDCESKRFSLPSSFLLFTLRKQNIFLVIFYLSSIVPCLVWSVINW